MEKISAYQLRILLILNTIGSAILVIPANLAELMKQDAWLSMILGITAGLLLIKFLFTIVDWFPTRDPVQAMELLLGKWLGKLVALCFVIFSFMNVAVVIWYVGNFMTIAIMPETPALFFHILFAGIIILAIRLGVENMARLAEFLFTPTMILFLIMIGLSLPYAKTEYLLPLFADNNFKSIFGGTLLATTYITPQLFPIAMFFPKYANNLAEAKKSYVSGFLIGGACLFITVLFSLLVLGPKLSAAASFTSFLLAKKVHLGLMERAEGIFSFIWIITIFFRATSYFFAAVAGLANIFGLKDYKSLALPIGLCIIPLSIIVYPDYIYKNIWDTTYWVSFYLCFGLLPLLILSGAAVFKRLTGGKIKNS